MISGGVRGLRQEPPSKKLLEARRNGLKNVPVLCPSDEVLLDLRPCLTCRNWGTALDNMGALACRFHPLAKNGPSGGRWHKAGVFECCGTSDDPHHEDFHAKFGKHGCCAKDHCPIDRIPYPRRIYEKDWPSILRENIYIDINKINGDRTNREWSDIVKGLQFKGLRIDNNDRFYLARIDEEMCESRMKHKFYKNQRLSKCIRVHTMKDGEDINFQEIVVADDAIVEEQFRYLRIDIDDGTNILLRKEDYVLRLSKKGIKALKDVFLSYTSREVVLKDIVDELWKDASTHALLNIPQSTPDRMVSFDLLVQFFFERSVNVYAKDVKRGDRLAAGIVVSVEDAPLKDEFRTRQSGRCGSLEEAKDYFINQPPL